MPRDEAGAKHERGYIGSERPAAVAAALRGDAPANSVSRDDRAGLKYTSLRPSRRCPDNFPLLHQDIYITDSVGKPPKYNCWAKGC